MDILGTLFSQGTRKIGMFVPSVVISEKHSDSSEITEIPVQVPGKGGFTVSDHTFDRPSEVVMEIGFAGGGSLVGDDDSSTMFDISTGLKLGSSPREIYQQLLDLRATKQPFDVITGKRDYKNMLIRAIEVTTDNTSENVLLVTLTLRQVIIVETKGKNVAPLENQKMPEVTGGTIDRGTVTPIPVDQSTLESLPDWAHDIANKTVNTIGNILKR
ncbi:phage baseplate protein [Providencia rettgeri]|uniref:phage baseplate protein n=1 Tax=Providencia rettgeri TaxID=587 RepID=UPI003019B7B0